MSTTTFVEQEIHAYKPIPQPISWGAVIAGLIFTFALSWLLFTLGSAIGLSLFEYSDPERVQPNAVELSTSVLVWVFITTLIAFFCGGLLAGRLAGKPDRAVGLLHGVAVWSSATLVSLLLGSMGVSGIATSAFSALKTTTTAGGAAAALFGAGVEDDVQIPSYMQPLVSTLKRQISEGVANAANEAGPRNMELTNEEVRTTAQQLDSRTLAVIAAALVRGDQAQAKDIVADNTHLSELQVNKIIANAQHQVDRISQTMKQKVDAIEDYAAGVLWIVFVSSAAALVVAILGGYAGANSVSRIYAVKLY